MWSSRKLCAAIFLLAATLRLVLVFGFGRHEIGRPEPIKIAISLATKGTFADPFSIPTGPTAHNPPFYPALISVFYRLFGDTPAADFGRMALSTLTAAVEYALLPLVSSALGLGVWPGISAGVGGALIPLHLWPECMGEFENTWCALLLECATIWTGRFLRAPACDWRAAVVPGLFTGAAILISPSVLPVLFGLFAIALWRLRPAAAVAARMIAVFAGGALLVSSAWMIRNYIQLGGFVLGRDNFGLELAISNNDSASPDATENGGGAYYRTFHPHHNLAAAQEVRRSGELAYQRRMLGRAVEWMRSHPQHFLRLCAERTGLFWFPRVLRLRWLYGLCSVMSFAGLLLLWRRNRLAAGLLATVLVGYGTVYALIENVLRYQHPIWWVQVLLMGWLAQQAWSRATAKPAASGSFPE